MYSLFVSFGIFRITDPPGLDVILNCQAKEAFHPHPDQAIYTVSSFGLEKVSMIESSFTYYFFLKKIGRGQRSCANKRHSS